MSGARKLNRGKVYATFGSNIEQLGTEVDRKCKATAADTESEWKKSGKTVGLMIWRVENFKVVPWPEKSYGQFYDGDSYIVLYTYGKAPDLYYNIHYWLGKNTSTDEAGTAAYKTVELDTFHHDKPVQYREVQGHESPQFLDYFKNKGGIRILTGGVESGFHKVEPEKYKPILLHFKGKFQVRITQVPLAASSLNSGDVFVLDAGLKLYQFNGAKSATGERGRAATLCRAIDDERAGKPQVFVIEEGQADSPGYEEFWTLLGGKGPIGTADESDTEAEIAANHVKKLFKLSDASGKLTFEEVASNKVYLSQFKSADVYILDAGIQIFVWIGSNSSKQEKEKGMSFAGDYLKHANKPAWISVAKIFEQGENEVFRSMLDGK